MNTQTTVLILITSSNLVATVIMAKAALDAKRRMNDEINQMKIKTSQAVSKFQNALDELTL